MRAVLIILGIVVAVPLLLIAVLAFLLANPDYYRTQLAATIEESTGFVVDISGEMNWRYFPPIAISMEGVNIRPGGSETPLASIGRADVDVGLIPLVLRGELAVDALTFEGLTINARIDEQGRPNWDTGKASGESPPAETGDASALSLNIQEVRLLDTTISYVDLEGEAEYRLDVPRFVTGAIRGGQPTPVEFAMSVTDVVGGMSAELSGSGDVTIAEGLDRISFDGLSLQNSLALPGMPGISIRATTSGEYDLDQSLLQVQFDGAIDSTTLNGRASVNTATDITAIEFDVALGELNADLYLPTEAAGDPNASAPAEDAEVLPLDTLRSLDIDGQFTLSQLMWSGYTFNGFTADIQNRRNKLTADIGMAGYGGQIGLGFTGTTAGRGAGQTSATVSGLDLAQFLESDWITGTLEFESNTTFTGHMLSEVLGTLDGTTTFEIAGGTLDVRPIKQIAAIVDALRGQQSGVAAWPDMMPFDNMTGQHRFIAGARDDQQLEFALNVMKGEGTGGFDYFDNRMVYDLTFQFLENDSEFSVGPGLARIEWPLHCEGPLDATPVELCLPDRKAIQDILASAAKQELKRKGTEAIKEKLGEGLRKLFGN